jgi:hypothetical protein
MLTFVSGWRSLNRDKALFKQRDPNRRAVFFIENPSSFPDMMPDAPIIDIWRNGVVEFKVECDSPETLIRLNYDTEGETLNRALIHHMLSNDDAQIVLTYDAVEQIYRLLPALRARDALLAADERIDAPPGDRVVFSRGGSFLWPDHILESQTSLLLDEETLDVGIIPEDINGW